MGTRQFTAAEQARYDRLDEDVAAGRVATVRRGTLCDGSRISDKERDAVLHGRPDPGRPAPPAPAGPAPPGPPARAHQPRPRRLPHRRLTPDRQYGEWPLTDTAASVVR